MKKLTRAIVLVCIFAIILSSVAFAAVDLPTTPPRSPMSLFPVTSMTLAIPIIPTDVSMEKSPCAMRLQEALMWQTW